MKKFGVALVCFVIIQIKVFFIAIVFVIKINNNKIGCYWYTPSGHDCFSSEIVDFVHIFWNQQEIKTKLV